MSASLEKIQESYRSRTVKSLRLMEEARKVMPGGDTRTTAHFLPYPVFMEKGEGCRLTDVDGNEYIDFMNNFTSLILGHGHPKVVAAVSEQVRRGTAYAAPTETQTRLAEMICARVPSIEQIRFCSCGSEGTLMAARAARAFTGKQKIMKIEGGYNGNHDLGEISLSPTSSKAGPMEDPIAFPPDKGVALSSVADTLVTPFNEPEITERQIKKHRDEIAALILEPMLGGLGMIPPKLDYLREIRRITAENDILLILDEVITLRLSLGGAQEMFDIHPDLTALGKIIGGGLPIGGFGGRKEIMQQFNPERPHFMWHASTFSGNPVTMAAGIAALEELTPEIYERVNRLGDTLRKKFNQTFQKNNIRGQATGLGSLLNLHFTDQTIHNARDSIKATIGAGSLPMHFHLCLLQHGIFPAGRQMYCISTPMTDREIGLVVEALDSSLKELRPIIERDFSHLLL
jgi:glutamate-1-semialdehyde 2,1-aminomutase